MNEIKCPKCGTVFTVDETGYADLVKQVRDQEFAREVEARERLLAREKEQALALAHQEAASELQAQLSARDTKIAQLTAQIAAADGQLDAARKQAAAEARAAADRDAAAAREEAQRDASALQREVDRLTAELERQQTVAQLDLANAVAVVQQERDQARAELAQERAVATAQREQADAAHALELEQAKKANEALIRYKDEEIERLRDMKARLSTKMVGETLEQHCETEFNRLRMTAFPRAYFEKDNDASAGTKGDYIFRECDEAGNEIISIMFEMKNENDQTATKHKNEDFFKKLDHDRTQKGCEYAVLVTLLEPESELYNAGIVDVSYRYPKMYVIRPQFFIPMITLLRNAAMGALAYKQELAQVRQQNIDVTNFEAKLEDFQGKFQRNYRLASDRFQDAIAAIDKGIKDLQTVREKLLASEDYIRKANGNVQDLTIRKLTWGNPTMKAAFEAARSEHTEGGFSTRG